MATVPPHVLESLLHATGQILTWGAKRTLAAPSPLKAQALDVAIELDLGLDSGDDFILLTSSQVEEIESFLADPAVVSLSRLRFIRAIAPPEAAKAIDEVANALRFQGLATQWCTERGQTWHDVAQHLWNVIDRNQQYLLSNMRANGTLTDSVTDALLTRFFFGQFQPADPPEYIRLINELAQNPTRQHQLKDLLSECDRQARIPASDEFLVLGLEHDRAKFDALYVDRDLIDAVSGEAVSASQRLDVREACPRVLIIGDPGVGKSTLTSWIKWKLLSGRSDGYPPIVITLISRYDLTLTSSSIISAIIQQFKTQFLTECDEKTLSYLLSVGWLTLIVDGIDEILDTTQRRRIVDQLNILAQKYPALPIVVTTRQTGFEVSHFRAPTFDLLQLQQYSDAQVQEYANKWFTNLALQLKADRFLGEARFLGDLVKNPLLLALLCTLYRQYDYIPQSRRELYLRCASLMFYEWDPRRGIAIPNLFKREGDSILREVALILLRKGGVGSSIEEDQLLDIIRKHLEDKGTEPIAALTAAHDLLDYCSRRAWIISKTSTAGNGNSFSFTHRTFFEFFASEAIIRTLNRQHALAYTTPISHTQVGSLGPVSQEILQSFEADHTSVLPELLLQAADDLMGGMSSAVLEELQRAIPRADRARKSNLVALCIRLVAAGGAHTSVVERVFDSVAKLWSDVSEDVVESNWPLTDFRALLNIPSGHRARFIARCMNDKESLGRYFRQGYSRLGVIGETGLYSDDWRDCFVSMAEATAPGTKYSMYDAFDLKYRWLLGSIDIDTALCLTHGRDLLVLSVEDQLIKGIFWDALGRSTEVSRRSWNSSYKAFFSTGGFGPKIPNKRLPEFIEAPPAADRRLISFKMAALVAALMWPGEPEQVARITGCPEVANLKDVLVKFDSAARLEKYSNARANATREAARSYRDLVRQDPPRWLTE